MFYIWFFILLLLLFVLFEAVCRVLLVNKCSYLWQPYQKKLLYLNREVFHQLPSPVKFTVNRWGERGGQPPFFLGSTWTALVLGGSAAECYFLDQPESWPEVMKTHLSNPDFLNQVHCRRIHVGNIGKSGLDSADIDFILDSVCSRYKRLDIIILLLGAGDVNRWLSSGAPKNFKTLGRKNPTIFALSFSSRYNLYFKDFFIYKTLKIIRDSFSPVVMRDVGCKLNRLRNMRRNAKYIISDMPENKYMIDNFENNLKSILKKSKKLSTNVLLIKQPWFDKNIYSPEEESLFWHSAKGIPHKNSVDTYYSFEIFNQLMHDVSRRADVLCKRYNVDCLDLKSVISNSSESYYDNLHFTNKGAAVVGEVVANCIKKMVCRG